jgi:DNA polymerase III subunit gamma/tau
MADTSFALYRKYRPQDWSEVRNQDHIVSVLKGAIEKHVIPHALLFTGTRGTGKTTVARIFARAIGVADVDIYEIDAASNRGIDDIRALKEAVYTLPFESPYKVYIIDEVHMLTKDAFNALLKTLEEPPEYVVFILATTEQDKLLDTITSRCQVFRFRSPTREELTAMIRETAEGEKVTLEKGAAEVIALAADGSYRDALSILQKVLVASNDRVLAEEEVAMIVGAPRRVLVTEFLSALHEKDTARGLKALHEASTARVDMKLFLALLLSRMRAIMLLRHKALSGDVLGEFVPEEQELIERIARDAKSTVNSRALIAFLEAGTRIGYSSIPQLPLELALIEIASS